LQSDVHFGFLPSAHVSHICGNGQLVSRRKAIECTPHKVVYLPGSSTSTTTLYAVVVSTDIEADLDAEMAVERKKVEESGEEYDQINARWGNKEEFGEHATHLCGVTVALVFFRARW
jgi:hypothetical protein